jgi:hypothetical protein
METTTGARRRSGGCAAGVFGPAIMGLWPGVRCRSGCPSSANKHARHAGHSCSNPPGTPSALPRPGHPLGATVHLSLSRFKLAGPPTPRGIEASNAYAIIHDSLGPVCICGLIGINSSIVGRYMGRGPAPRREALGSSQAALTPQASPLPSHRRAPHVGHARLDARCAVGTRARR